jgi:hypothetical protein
MSLHTLHTIEIDDDGDREYRASPDKCSIDEQQLSVEFAGAGNGLGLPTIELNA